MKSVRGHSWHDTQQMSHAEGRYVEGQYVILVRREQRLFAIKLYHTVFAQPGNSIRHTASGQAEGAILAR